MMGFFFHSEFLHHCSDVGSFCESVTAVTRAGMDLAERATITIGWIAVDIEAAEMEGERSSGFVAEDNN